MTTDQNEKLNSEVFEITTGLLLGDGNLQKPRQCKNYRFRFAQNQKREDYVNWLLKKYQTGIIDNKKPLVKNIKPHRYEYKTSCHKKREISFGFQTRISSAFDEHAKIFYANKSTTKNLCNDLSCFENLITPCALAYWYMDDGSWPNKGSFSFILCTYAFKLVEVIYLSDVLNKQFDLISKVSFNKKQPIIAISAKCYPVLFKLISPYLNKIPSMAMKFPTHYL